jgi:hypothetical protein
MHPTGQSKRMILEANPIEVLNKPAIRICSIENCSIMNSREISYRCKTYKNSILTLIMFCVILLRIVTAFAYVQFTWFEMLFDHFDSALRFTWLEQMFRFTA